MGRALDGLEQRLPGALGGSRSLVSIVRASASAVSLARMVSVPSGRAGARLGAASTPSSVPASASVETTVSSFCGAARRGTATAAAVAAALFLVLLLALGLGLGLEQSLTVGDRDLIVIGMDFAEGEEPVAVSAVFHEGRLERRFDAGDLGEIDIPAQLLPVSGFEVEFFDLLTTHHHDPGFFRVGGIDEHLVCHVELSTWRSRAGPEAGAALWAVEPRRK